ncbi:MAG: SgcJ/EcaC family oxidoreductase [Betaproteobacteria bacterium]|nr:MAG: SgcJ/EcaC family oxidoreductase [Betaproteobacteria bacterium]
MPAHTPEEIDSLFAQALNAGNVDALVALYEPQASLMPSPGTLVAGTAAIREALAAFVAGKPAMQIAPRLVSQSGDLAVVTAKWQLAMTGQDGKPAQMQGQSVEVVRRQSDGRWLFVIDLPFGVEAGAKA